MQGERMLRAESSLCVVPIRSQTICRSTDMHRIRPIAERLLKYAFYAFFKHPARVHYL
jgi:hypothetical protein